MKKFIVRAVLILVSFILLVQLWIFCSLAWWRTHPVETTMFMRIDYWSDPSEPLHHEWRDYDHISDTFKRAVVAAEDGKFLQHHGFDWDGIQYALEKNEKKISRLVSSLAELEDTATKGSIVKGIDELHSEGELLKSRIAELESLTASHTLSNIEFDIIRQMLTTFKDTVDDMSVEQKRAALRTFVKKVV